MMAPHQFLLLIILIIYPVITCGDDTSENSVDGPKFYSLMEFGDSKPWKYIPYVPPLRKPIKTPRPKVKHLPPRRPPPGRPPPPNRLPPPRLVVDTSINFHGSSSLFGSHSSESIDSSSR
ncbi:UNVERIFIED_CONTAM: hypothetical protein Sindi_0382100 [Sesamum indicum]